MNASHPDCAKCLADAEEEEARRAAFRERYQRLMAPTALQAARGVLRRMRPMHARVERAGENGRNLRVMGMSPTEVMAALIEKYDVDLDTHMVGVTCAQDVDNFVSLDLGELGDEWTHGFPIRLQITPRADDEVEEAARIAQRHADIRARTAQRHAEELERGAGGAGRDAGDAPAPPRPAGEHGCVP